MNHDFDVMVLAAHPDDAEICCAGTILSLLAGGKRVAIVDMTEGDIYSLSDVTENILGNLGEEVRIKLSD